ncbi:phosphate acyltransferase, partial [Enterococcus faecalis]
PVLAGLAKPVNDLSRGCSSQDVYEAAILTAAQSLDEE